VKNYYTFRYLFRIKRWSILFFGSHPLNIIKYFVAYIGLLQNAPQHELNFELTLNQTKLKCLKAGCSVFNAGWNEQVFLLNPEKKISR